MELPCVKGDRILLTDRCSQTFAGVVKTVNKALGRIMLADIVQLPEEKPIKGYRNFDRDEIVKIQKCEPSLPSDADDEANQPEKSPELELGEVQQTDKFSMKLPQLELDAIERHQGEYRLIRDFGTNFHAAISMLKACSMIGVYGKDVSKGRFGRASVLAISCPTNIFVFDVQGLGDDVFHRGLKEILESPDIIKVVHDCRLLSDCLKHKHLIKLENIRDVEAEDIMVLFQERRTIRRHSRSLEYLLKVYLGVEAEDSDEGEHTWKERPLPPNLLKGLVSSVSFLIPLQKAIERKYLQYLVEASNIYNCYMRDLDIFDIMNADTEKTLRMEISKLLVPQNNVRSEYRTKKPV